METPRIIDLENHVDNRGHLTVTTGIPFTPVRAFWIGGVPLDAVRGAHAHRTQHQLLICVCGAVNVNEFELNEPYHGLYVPPMNIITMKHFSPGAVLLVLSSGAYDAQDYVTESES